MIKVLIATMKKSIYSNGVQYFLGQKKDINIVGNVEEKDDLLASCSELKPDVVLIVLSNERVDSIALGRNLKEKMVSVKVIILTDFLVGTDALSAIVNGMDAYLPKTITADELELSIRAVMMEMPIIHPKAFESILEKLSNSSCFICGRMKKDFSNKKIFLLPREREIIKLMVVGKSNKEIAETLYLSEGRIRNIITTIYKKLAVKGRAQLIKFAIENAIVD